MLKVNKIVFLYLQISLKCDYLEECARFFQMSKLSLSLSLCTNPYRLTRGAGLSYVNVTGIIRV